MVDISNINEKIANIEPNLKFFLDYLKDAEGIKLERNSGEADITAPLGVYRKDHPEADVFSYIDSVAKSITTAPSNTWSPDVIKAVNAKLDSDVCYYLAYLFYKKFLAGANLSALHNETTITVASLYTNGPKAVNKSIQLAINFMMNKGVVKSVKGSNVGVDGAISPTGETIKELVNIKNYVPELDYSDPEAVKQYINGMVNLVFDLSIMTMMKTQYIDLDQADEARYHKFLDGWDNRVNNLLLL